MKRSSHQETEPSVQPDRTSRLRTYKKRQVSPEKLRHIEPERLQQTFLDIERYKFIRHLQAQLESAIDDVSVLQSALEAAIEDAQVASDFLARAVPIGESRDWIIDPTDPNSEKHRRIHVQTRINYQYPAKELQELAQAQPEHLQRTMADWQQAGQQAREEFLIANLPLVPAFCQRTLREWFTLREEDRQRWITRLLTGLDQAVMFYDPRSGNRFSTYANFWIRNEYLDAIREEHNLIHLPPDLHDLRSHIWALEDAQVIPSGYVNRDAKDILAELQKLDITASLEQVERVLQYPRVISLDAPVIKTTGEESDSTGYDFVPDEAVPVEEAVETTMQNQAVLALLQAADTELTDRERDILKRRHGISELGAQTLEEVGIAYNLTRERVRQIEEKALWKLRVYLAKNPAVARIFHTR